MNRRKWILIPPAVWIASLFLVQVLGAFAAPDSSEMPDECPEDSMNCARAMMGFQASPEDVLAAAIAWDSDVSIIDETNTTAHLVFRTDWMRYPDDMFLETGCTENGTWLQIHSESRLGRSDMGVNLERVDALLDHMTSIEFEASEC